MPRDRCYGGKRGWQTCTSCGGRIHDEKCKSRVNPKKDCCPSRHIRLGLTVESSQIRVTRI